jgi:hypothetical protein
VGAAVVGGVFELGAGVAPDVSCITAGFASSPQALRAAASIKTALAANCGART